MDKFLKKKIYVICILIFMLVCVLPIFFSIIYGKDPGSVGYNEWNDIPSDCGDVYTYMGWQTITNFNSDCGALIQKAGIDYNDDKNYDADGYGLIDGCYVIACSNNKDGGIGIVGDYIDFQLEDGVIINCIMGDTKNHTDAGWTVWGHDNGRCVVEFIVNKNTWYSGGSGSHVNPGQGDGNLDKVLKGKKVVKYIRKGNYMNGDRLGGTVASSNSSETTDLTDFWGAIKAIFGGIWDAVSVEFENLSLGREDITVRYDLNDKDDMVSSSQYNSSVRSNNGVVQFFQDDYADVPYGISGRTIASSGCGPVSVAMVVSTLTGKNVTPKDIVDWCGTTYYVPGSGTSWDMFPAAAKNWNLQCKESNDINEVVQALREGKLVISSQGRGLFTNNGHYIVLATIDSNGGILVNDPNKKNAKEKPHNGNKGYDNTTFTASEIDASAKHYWIFW